MKRKIKVFRQQIHKDHESDFSITIHSKDSDIAIGYDIIDALTKACNEYPPMKDFEIIDLS